MDLRIDKYSISLNSLENWLSQNEYEAYDPFDGLLSFLRIFTFRRKFPQQILQQFVRRIPFNIRPFIGIKPHKSSKGMSYLGSGYLKLYQLTNKKEYKKKAIHCFEWLIDNSLENFSGKCWGNSFDYISRGFYLPKESPTLVWTSLIGCHFLEAYRILEEPRYLDVAKNVGKFILKDIPRMSINGSTCLSYIVHDEVSVHNANLLGAKFLIELYKDTSNSELIELATVAIQYSTNCQLPNGAWYYGEEDKYHWIDNWHTAYNLDSLLSYQLITESTKFEPHLMAGVEFYEKNFFTDKGAPKYYWNRDYKYDIQSSSQSIDTLLNIGMAMKLDHLVDKAFDVADWTIKNMQDPDGFFYFWKNKWFINKTPTFHWGEATMFRALSALLLVNYEK